MSPAFLQYYNSNISEYPLFEEEFICFHRVCVQLHAYNTVVRSVQINKSF